MLENFRLWPTIIVWSYSSTLILLSTTVMIVINNFDLYKEGNLVKTEMVDFLLNLWDGLILSPISFQPTDFVNWRNAVFYKKKNNIMFVFVSISNNY